MAATGQSRASEGPVQSSLSAVRLEVAVVGQETVCEGPMQCKHSKVCGGCRKLGEGV